MRSNTSVCQRGACLHRAPSHPCPWDSRCCFPPSGLPYPPGAVSHHSHVQWNFLSFLACLTVLFFISRWWWLLRERNPDLLLHVCMHSLLILTCAPTRDPTHNLDVSGGRSNQCSYQARALLCFGIVQPDFLWVEKCNHFCPLGCCHLSHLTPINFTLVASTSCLHREKAVWTEFSSGSSMQ